MSIKRYGISSNGLLFSFDDGYTVTYDDHIAEVSRVIAAENERLESCRKMLEECQAKCHRLSVEVEYWKASHAGLKSAEETVFHDLTLARTEAQRLRGLLSEASAYTPNDLTYRIASECGNDRHFVQTSLPEQDHG